MMTYQTIIVGFLLVIAVGLCLLCAIGLFVARNSYQRLQFCTPVASAAMPLIAAAIWVGDPNWQARLKATLIALFLLIMNAVVSHATASSIRIRDKDHWPTADDEKISRGPLLASFSSSY